MRKRRSVKCVERGRVFGERIGFRGEELKGGEGRGEPELG